MAVAYAVIGALVVGFLAGLSMHRAWGLFAKKWQDQIEANREPAWLHRQQDIILNSAGEGIFGVNLDGRITFCNPAAARMSGYSVEEMIGRVSHDMLHHTQPDGQVYPVQACPQYLALKNGQALRFDDEIIWRKDGTSFPIACTTTPIQEDGKIVGAVTTFNDVSERRRMQKEYAQLYRQYQLMLNSADEGICGTNKVGQIVFCNPAIERMTGYTQNEMLGQYIHALFHHTRSDGSSFPLEECPAHQAFLDGMVLRATDELYWRKDGTSFPVDYVMSPLIEDGEIIGSVLLVQDVTGRKHAEEMLLKSAKLSVVGELAAGVAHEIRNPLTSLKGFVQLLETKFDGHETYFRIMNSELNRIETIVDEFLVLAKPQPLNFKLGHPETVLNNVLEVFKSQASLRNVHIDMHCHPDVPPIYCDENRLKQVFVNILKNAVEAMPDGGDISIDIGIANPDDYVVVQITDKGHGIPDDRIAKLGEPFYTTKEKGTGLGLMITHRIIEAHQGFLRIESEVGEGTTVGVGIPAGAVGQGS